MNSYAVMDDEQDICRICLEASNVKKDKLISNLDLVSREEFEVLKKLVQKQDGLIKKLLKKKSSTKAKKS